MKYLLLILMLISSQMQIFGVDLENQLPEHSKEKN